MRNFRRVLFGALLIFIIGGSFCLCGCDDSLDELWAKYDKAYKKYQKNPTEKNYIKYRKYFDKYIEKRDKISDSEELYNSRNEFWTIETNDNSNNIQENNKETLSEQIKEKEPETYDEWLAKAKQYENEKRWCYALGAYYDAMGIVDIEPESKLEAFNGYNALKETILAGNPGFGTFNEFSMHDEWKNLLIDAEKYGCSFNPYEVTVGNLVRESLDYTNKTASYSADISYSVGNRYNRTIKIIEQGYYKSRRIDWKDLPRNWPKYSASYNNDGVYNVNGAYIFRTEAYDLFGDIYEYRNYNAFEEVEWPLSAYSWYTTLIDCKFNVVDENGKELVKPKRCLLGMEDEITIKDVPAEVMGLIDNGKAFINPVACYIEYGRFRREDVKGGRSFIKNFPEAQLLMDKSVFICWNNKNDKIYEAVKKVEEYLSK